MTNEKSKASFNLPLIGSNVTPILVVLLIVASFFIGSLWTKVKYLEKVPAQPVIAANNGNNAPTPQAPGDDGTPVKVSIDDDPVLGDKNAKVTLIDFSDYECPFCKRHFT